MLLRGAMAGCLSRLARLPCLHPFFLALSAFSRAGCGMASLSPRGAPARFLPPRPLTCLALARLLFSPFMFSLLAQSVLFLLLTPPLLFCLFFLASCHCPVWLPYHSPLFLPGCSLPFSFCLCSVFDSTALDPPPPDPPAFAPPLSLLFFLAVLPPVFMAFARPLSFFFLFLESPFPPAYLAFPTSSSSFLDLLPASFFLVTRLFFL